MGSGEVTQFINVTNIDDCEAKCCQSKSCDVAFVIRDVCYTIKCYSRNLCRTKPLENDQFTSKVVYVSRNGVTMFSSANDAKFGGEHSKILATARPIAPLPLKSNTTVVTGDAKATAKSSGASVPTDKTTGINRVSITIKPMTKPATNSLIEDLGLKATSLPTPHRASKTNMIPKAQENNQTMTAASLRCQAGRNYVDIRLKGDLDAGQFTKRGLVTNMAECTRFCCDDRSCDLAYLLGKICYTVKCNDADLCRVVASSPTSLNPIISYVTRYDENGEMLSKLSVIMIRVVCKNP